MRRQISLELSSLTSQHDLFIKTTTTSAGKKHEILTDVLDGRNIQTKKEVVMQGRKLHKVTRRKISSHDSHVHGDNKMPTNANTTPAGDSSDGCGYDDDVMEESGEEISSRPKPLSELTVDEVERLLESIEFDEYKAVFAKNKIDGKCLIECYTCEDVVNMGITIFVKARIFLNKVKKWKGIGFPLKHFSDDQAGIQDDLFNLKATTALQRKDGSGSSPPPTTSTATKKGYTAPYNSKLATGMVGLENLGATCYLNALLQVID